MPPDEQPDLQQALLPNGDQPSKSKARSLWGSELKDLLHLAAPACLQLCAQQGLVVSQP